jgi:hypothetical protein
MHLAGLAESFNMRFMMVCLLSSFSLPAAVTWAGVGLKPPAWVQNQTADANPSVQGVSTAAPASSGQGIVSTRGTSGIGGAKPIKPAPKPQRPPLKP